MMHLYVMLLQGEHAPKQAEGDDSWCGGGHCSYEDVCHSLNNVLRGLVMSAQSSRCEHTDPNLKQ